MSILQIELPDEQLQVISEQARASGFEDNAQYLLAVVQRLADYDWPAEAEEISPAEAARRKRLLLESLECGEPEVADDAWWAELQADVDADVKAKAARTGERTA